MADTTQMLARIRRGAGDSPPRTRIANSGGITKTATTIELPAGDVEMFRDFPLWVDFGDGTEERALVIASDPDATPATITLAARPQDGTEASAHEEDADILIRPRYSNAQILDAMRFIIDDELWPHVWVPGELTLTWQPTSRYYAPDIPGIEEVVYAYQWGTDEEQYPIRHRWVPAALTHESDFPEGMLEVWGTWDDTDLHVAYRRQPSFSDLDGLEGLVVLGTAAHLQTLEEMSHVAPDAALNERRMREGSRARAGLVLQQRFEASRAKRQAELLQMEQRARERLRL